MCYKESKDKNTKKKIILSQRSVANSAIKLHDKRDIIIEAFVNKDICPGDVEEDVQQYVKPSYEESIADIKMRRQNQGGKGFKIVTPH